MKENIPANNPNFGKSYLKKPISIGAVIKRIVKEKQISKEELATRLKIHPNGVYRVFRMTHTSTIEMLRFSKAVDENLLLEYHPNVAPKPNPLEAENAQLKSENAQLKQQLVAHNAVIEENKILKAQLDLLRDVMKGKM